MKTMKNDRLGLMMIAASLVAIAIVSALLYAYQVRLHQETTRIHGVALTRALSSVEYSQLVSGNGAISQLRTLANVQADTDFAYGIVVSVAGEKLYETTSAGSIAPAAVMPTEPFAWFGEHRVMSPGDGRPIREFFAPVMKDGQLAGFIRVGYYDKPAGMPIDQISAFGLMALPIFLLTALSYFLIRREVKPLWQLGERMAQASRAYGAQLSTPPNGQDMGDFIQRFDQFMSLVQSRARQTDAQSDSAQAATHLLAYKQGKAESALNSIPDAVLVMDDDCIPTFANSKIEPILGIGRKEIIGRAPPEWCDNKEILAFLMRFKGSPSAMRMASMEYAPGGDSERRVAVAAFPLFSPRDQTILFGMLIVFRDISNEYQAKRTGAEFVSHVAHELKTPLNTLSAYSELLLDYATLSETDRVDAVNVISSEVARMSGLINNLLNISKLETGTLPLVRTRVKLQGFLQDAFDSMTHNAMGKSVALDLHIPPDIGSVRLDKDLFRIAIDNLLSNAIKYSNPGGQVTVTARNLDDDQIRISVRDRGIGITPQDCEKVFLKYYRANNSETALRSGHGLGLYLAKQIIEMHQGSLTVQSEPGKGSEFIILFKVQSSHLEESQAL